jgi:thioredoxin-dependent peroxiredoxin
MFGLFEDPLPVGSDAPPFLLPDEDGNVFTLNLNRNKIVVLVFYPADDTPGCTKQLCALNDNLAQLKEHGLFPVGVNPGDAPSHKKFKAKFNYGFPLLVDAGRRVAKLYRCSGPIVKRTVYIIGRDGKIKFAQRGTPGVAEILAAAGAATPTAKS